jgi:abortive infection bacteriophage resistance protein
MVFEELTIGNVSTILNILKSDHSKEIAKNYTAYYIDVRKWLNLITQIRNISAHHSRLWNNSYKVRPRVEDTMFKNKYILEELNGAREVKSNYYNSFLIIEYLLSTINK